MRILIADDDPVSRRSLQAILGQWGHEVTSVADGQEAWDALRPQGAPGIAILDWMMPGLDGLTVCRRARERVVPYVYIILLTAREKREDLLEGLSAGADDFLTKPLDAAELQARLRTGQRILDLQQSLLETQSALQHEASHDALTGVWNRMAVSDLLRRELRRSLRNRHELSVVLVDLDHFKRVNDTHGHAAGDAILRESIQRIQDAVRAYDTLGRYGGEEFLLVLPECGADDAHATAERIRVQLAADPMPWQGCQVEVTASLGVATARGEIPAEHLIHAADLALYRAKNGGRNRVEIATAEDLGS